MKFLKIGLSIVAALTLLLVIGAIIFIATFDANEYKPLISEQVKQQTGRDFTLEDIKPSVFPWIGIELKQISLGNAKGFKADKMLKMESLDVKVELLPLLQSEVRIDTLRVYGLELFLAKNKKGKTNWDDIVEKQTETKGEKIVEKDNKTETTESVDPLAALLINGIEIKDANINWDDMSSGQVVALQKINIKTGTINPDKPMPLDMSATVKLSEPAVEVALKLKTSIDFDLPTKQLNLNNVNIMIDAAMQQDDIEKLQLDLNAQIKADINKQRFILPVYTLDVSVNGKAVPNGVLEASVKGDADIDLNKQTANIKALSIESLGLKLKTQISATDLMGDQKVKGRFNVDKFNVKNLMNKLAIDLPKTKNKDALKNADLSFMFTANNQSLTLKKLKMHFDESIINMNLKLVDFEKSKISYDIKLDKIVLDDYLPPVVDPVAVKAKAGAVPAKQDIVIDLPVSMMRSLDINGLIKINSIKAFDQSINNIQIKTRAKNGLITLPILNAQALQGKVIASASIDVRNNLPKYKLKMKGSSLKAGSLVNPMLQDMLGEKSVALSGSANIGVDVTTKGKSVNQLIAGSNGKFNIKMGAAKLHGVDAEYFVRKGVVDFLKSKKQQAPADWRGEYKPKETTALKQVRASAVIRNGVIDNRDLLLDSSHLKITGTGKIDLPKEKLNYRVVVDVKPKKLESAGERLLDVPMPIFVKGSFSQPAISIDSKVWLKSVGKELKSEVKREIKKKLKQEKSQQKKTIKDKLKKKLDKYKFR